MGVAQLTMLNSMASNDFETGLRLQKAWGLKWVDLRDEIYGRWVEELDLPTAERIVRAVDEQGLGIYCVSTNVFVADVDGGEAMFRSHLQSLRRVVSLCELLRPQLVRLNAPSFAGRSVGHNSIETIRQRYPWLVVVCREAVDLLTDAGVLACFENDAFDCCLSTPEEFIDFFGWLDRPRAAGLTWDVQNQWASGVFPTLDIYRQLKPLIRYCHVKGGQFEGNSDRLAWNVALEDASWPVVDITSAVVSDGVSPVICLNPAQHGHQKPGYNYEGIVSRDLAYLRRSVPGIE
jgi:sugar phosphate isomerase/epimerase